MQDSFNIYSLNIRGLGDKNQRQVHGLSLVKQEGPWYRSHTKVSLIS